MSNLAVSTNTNLAFWDDKSQLKEIKELFAPNLTDLEFKGFVGMGKALNLNPFLKEIWAVKYDKTKPGQIFIGRDGYRKVAQRQPEYDYHYAESIYSKDKFKVVNGEISHEYSFMDRGVLVGGYCIVKRKSSSRAVYAIVNITDYDKKQSNWNTMKETMIKKVAESQALRAAFQDTFGGTYSEDEVPEIAYSKPNVQTQKLKEVLNIETGEVIDSESVSLEPGEPVNIDQLTAIRDLMKEKNFTDKRKADLLEHYKVDDLSRLTMQQGEECIALLEKVK